MNPILLTAQQAQELHTTGRTGYREKCEYDVPVPIEDVRIFRHDHPMHGLHFTLSWSEYQGHDDGWEHVTDSLTPPRDTDTTYTVLEPCAIAPPGFVTAEPHLLPLDGMARRRIVFYDDRWHDGYGMKNLAASQMPDWAVRQHARITDIKLIISTEDGELLWDMDLEKVAV